MQLIAEVITNLRALITELRPASLGACAAVLPTTLLIRQSA